MKVLSVLSTFLMVGFPPSFCAQPAAEVNFRKEAGEAEQKLHFRSSSGVPSSTSAFSPSVSPEGANEEPVKESARLSTPADGSDEPNQDERDASAGKDSDNGSGRKEPGLDWLTHLSPAIFKNFFGNEGKDDAVAAATGGVADSSMLGRADPLDPTVSVDDGDLATAEDAFVPSLIEQIEAAMQPLFTTGLFSAIHRFKDLLMPASFPAPKVTSRMDENQCTFDMNLQNLPDTASLRVGVEGDRVFVEYADSIKASSGGEGEPPKKSQGGDDERMQHESNTIEPSASTGYSERSAKVYSFETFQVPSACDYKSARGGASRIGRDHLRISFPRKKSSGEDVIPPREALEASEGSQEPISSKADLTAALDPTWDSASPFTPRFMKEKNAYSTGKVTGLAGLLRDKLVESEKLSSGLSEQRRYIPVVEEDSL